MNSPSSNQDTIHPTAVVRTSTRQRWIILGSRMWILTLICLVAAVGLTWLTLRDNGLTIAINFEQGHGIKPGDTLRYLGIEVGHVTSVDVDQALRGVVVEVSLDKEAESFAREGSRFWIVRPEISLSRVRGIDTVIGAKYLSVTPGPTDAAVQTQFVGVESPPLLPQAELAEIDVRFRQGFGLAVGDPVKYRGIVIGEVKDIRLQPNLEGVAVSLQLTDSARSIARAGTQFWVERPRVSIREVRGLETLVTGRFIAVRPGPEDAASQSEFQGLDTAPFREMPEGGLEIVLFGPELRGLQHGAPVLYRGVRVGHIVTVGLASDATIVEARAFIQPAYRQLVRRDSVFWNESGIDFSVGFTGVEFTSDALSNVVTGGVAFATPNPPGPEINTGARFELMGQPDDDALTWQPHLPVGIHALPEGTQLPTLTRASVQWQEKRFGITRNRQATGWVLPLSDQQVLGDRQWLLPPERAIDGQATLALGGEEFPISRASFAKDVSLPKIKLDKALPASVAIWPSDQLRRPQAPEPCLLVRDGVTAPFPVTTNRLEPIRGGWQLDPAISLSDDWSGAVAVSIQDGRVLGMARIQKGLARIEFVAPKD